MTHVLARGSDRHPLANAPCLVVELRWRPKSSTADGAPAEWARERIELAALPSTRLHSLLPHALSASRIATGAHVSLLATAESVAASSRDGAAGRSDDAVGAVARARTRAGASAAVALASYLGTRVPGLDMILKPVLGLVLDPLVGQVIDMGGARLRENCQLNVDHAVGGKAPQMIAGALNVGISADVSAAVPDAVTAGVAKLLPKMLAGLAVEEARRRVGRTADAVVDKLLSPSTLARRRLSVDPSGAAQDAWGESAGTLEMGDAALELPLDVQSKIDDALGFPAAARAVGVDGEGLGAAGARRSGSRLPRDLSAGEWAGNQGLDGRGDTAEPARNRDFVAAALGVETVPSQELTDPRPERPRGAALLLQEGGQAAWAGRPRSDVSGDPLPPTMLPGGHIGGTLEDIVVEAVSRQMAMRLERALAVYLVPRVTAASAIGAVAGITRAVGGPWPSSAESHVLECEVCRGHGNVGGSCDRCHTGAAVGVEADEYSSYYSGYYGNYYAWYYARYFEEVMRGLDKVKAFRQWQAVPPWGPRWFASRCAARKDPGLYGGSEGASSVVCEDSAGAQREDWLRTGSSWRKTLTDDQQMPGGMPPMDAGMWAGETRTV